MAANAGLSWQQNITVMQLWWLGMLPAFKDGWQQRQQSLLCPEALGLPELFDVDSMGCSAWQSSVYKAGLLAPGEPAYDNLVMSCPSALHTVHSK